MKVVTADEMRRIDSGTIDHIGIPGMVLMERAGLAVARRVAELGGKKRVVVLSGGGNNGGDGIVTARNLHDQGWNARVLLLSTEKRLSQDCRHQLKIAKKSGVAVEFRKDVREADFHGAVVVDALLGTGISKEVRPPVSDVIEQLNRMPVTVFSVDIPSGISSDTGQVMGTAVRADYTVTFGLPKRGHVLQPGALHSGRLFVEDIGFPPLLLRSDDIPVNLVQKEDAFILMPDRQPDTHKGSYGHVLVVAGSRGKTGAALMTARACLRAGAGMVTLGVPDSLVDVFQGRVTEEMVLPLADDGTGAFSRKAFDGIVNFLSEKADVLAIGPGMSLTAETEELVKRLLPTVTVPAVCDADALNALSGAIELLGRVRAPFILTPHPGEMARLMAPGHSRGKKSGRFPGRDGAERIAKDRIGAVQSFSGETGAYIVLKGSPTVIAEPDGSVYVNSTGNPGMATAGTGDVLTGVVAALLGQGLYPLDAAVLGAYLHGSAGDMAAAELGMHSLIASDVISYLPDAFNSLNCNA